MTGVWGMWGYEQVCERVWWSRVMSAWVTFPLRRVIDYGTLDTAGNGGVDSVRTAGTPGETLSSEGTVDSTSSFHVLPGIIVFLWIFFFFIFPNGTPSFQMEGMVFYLILSLQCLASTTNIACVQNPLLIDWFLPFPMVIYLVAQQAVVKKKKKNPWAPIREMS